MKKSFRSTAGVLMALCLLASALSGSAAAFGAGTDIEINTEKGIISDYSECGTDAYGQETEGNAEVQIRAAEAFEVSDGTEANSGISENSTYDAEADGSIAETGSFSELNEAGTADGTFSESGSGTGLTDGGTADEGITESGSGSEINGNGTSETDCTGNNNGTGETEVGTDPAEAGDSNTDNDSEKTGEGTADGSVVPGQADEEKPREQETEDGSSGNSGAGNDTSADAKGSSKGLNNASDAVDEKAAVREGQKWLAVRKVGNGSVYIDGSFAEKIEPEDKRYPSGLPGAAVFLEETVRENMQQPDDEVITDDLLNIEAVQNTEAVQITEASPEVIDSSTLIAAEMTEFADMPAAEDTADFDSMPLPEGTPGYDDMPDAGGSLSSEYCTAAEEMVMPEDMAALTDLQGAENSQSFEEAAKAGQYVPRTVIKEAEYDYYLVESGAVIRIDAVPDEGCFCSLFSAEELYGF